MTNIGRALIVAVGLALVLPSWAGAAEYAVEILETSQVYPGTTIFMETFNPSSPKVVEIDHRGRVVWEYRIPAELVQGAHPDRGADVKWLPETDHVLFVLPLKGVFEVDRAGQIVWRHETPRISHAAQRLADGHTLFAWGWDQEDQAQATEVDREGRVVWQWFAAQHLDPALRRHPRPAEEDGFGHANSVQRLGNGQTLISLRNFHVVVEVEPSGRVAWSLPRQRYVHQPKLLPNGNVLLSHHGPQSLREVSAKTANGCRTSAPASGCWICAATPAASACTRRCVARRKWSASTSIRPCSTSPVATRV
jgi:hypothetical protein